MKVIGSKSARKATAKKIANKAVERLFVNGATRLALVDLSRTPARYLGELTEGAVKDAIVKAIETAFKEARVTES